MAQTLDELKTDIFNGLKLRLGGGIVDVEVDPEHFESA